MPTTNSVTPIQAGKKQSKDGLGFMGRMVDTLSGLISGLGTEKDKMAQTVFTLPVFSQSEADAAYRADWVARKLVNIPPYDATREWRTWQGDPDAITAIEDLEKTLGLLRKVMSAIQKARLYGGGALILGVNQGKNDEELDYDKLKLGDLQFVHAVSRYDISTGPMVRDIGSPYLGEPEYYERAYTAVEAGGGIQGTKFHPSRVVRFIGEERQDAMSTGEVWGDSILQSTMDAIKSAGIVTNSSAQLVAEAKVDIIRIPGLSEQMATKAYEDKLTKRFAVANMIKGVYSMLLLDKEEEWQRENITFTGLPDMMQMALLIASGAGDIPATRFLGQSPAGLSSTGESDLRNYYDNVGTIQKVVISPTLARLDNVLIPSALGSHPEELFYLWNSLWQMTAKEKADTDKSKADTYKVDVDANLIDPVVLKKAREAQLIEDGTYPGFEQILDEWDGVGAAEEEEAAAQAAEQFGTAANENSAARAENDPEANPEKMEEEGGGNDPATKAKPRKLVRKPGKRAVGDSGAFRPGLFKSMKKRLADATPRTLYVSRKLLNVDDLKAWAKSQGFTSILEDLHVTIIYSKTAVDWIKLADGSWGEDEKGNLTIKPGGPRVMEQFGKAEVLVFGSDALTYRNMRFRDMGCSYDYDDFNPHVTISYAGVGAAKLAKVKPYQGVLMFGPEIFEELNPEGFDGEEDAKETSL